MYILALTYQHPERRDDAFKILADHKGYIEDPQIIQENLFLTLKKFEESYKSSPLAEMINEAVEKDGKFCEQNLDKIESAVKESLDFFRPYSETAKIDKISLMPTDPLYKKDSGAAFVFGNEVVIKNNVENPDNFNHEFLHGIINPIVEKLSARLSKEQKAKIVQMASDNLKNDYGDGYLDLLSEELIRTYNNVFKKGERPLTFDDLSQRIGDINEEQFKKILTQNAKFKARCDELGLFTLDGFRISAKDYFDRFEKNQLRDLIFDLYSEYSDKINAKDENFEQFISANLPKKI